MHSRTVQDRASPARNTYHLRQTKSSQSPSTRLPLASKVPAPSPPPPKARPSSIRTNHRISFNLVSLVTKFEALDALSLPFKVLSLQPAPLQVSPRPRKRGGGTVTGHFRRLSTIFSPPSRSGINNDDPFISEDDPVPGRDNLFSSSKSRTFGSATGKTNTKKLRKVQSTYNNGSVRTSVVVATKAQGTPASSVTAPYVKNEFPSRDKRSIRDMIKLYDGAASDGVLTKGKPSTIGSRTPNTPTPISRHKPSELRCHLSPSTGNSRLRLQKYHSRELESPTRLYRFSQRSLLLDSPEAKKESVGQNSPSKSSVSSMHVSPRTYDRARYQAPTRSSNALDSPNRYRADENIGQGMQKDSIARTTVRPEMERGRSLVRKNVPARYDRRQISEKIETLYQAKSIERKQDHAEAQNSKMSFRTTGKRNQHTGQAPTDSDFGKYLRRKSSKVAAMTKIFDNGSAPRPSVMVATPRKKPVFSATSPFAETDNTPASGAPRAPTPPPMPSTMLKRKSTISPKTIQEPLAVHSENSFPTKARTHPIHQHSLLHKKPSQPKGRAINEKIQLFENVRDGKETVPAGKRSTFARKISRSLRSLFEPSSRRSDDDETQAGQRRGLNGRELKNIVDEVQEANKSVRIGKRTSTLTGRWNGVLPAPVVNGCDGAISEKGFGSPSAAEVQEMVVKEAECGLKEPKPVRIAEVKRMMLICKERFEDMMDKDKVQARKF